MAGYHKKEHKNMGFGAPAAPSAGIQWKDFNGALFVIEPLEAIDSIKTAFDKPGETSTAVRANVHRITGAETSEDYLDTLIFPKILQSQVKKYIGTGDSAYGRLVQGQAKPGQSAPWMLDDPTAEDLEKVVAWDNARRKTGFQAPASTASESGSKAPF